MLASCEKTTKLLGFSEMYSIPAQLVPLVCLNTGYLHFSSGAHRCVNHKAVIPFPDETVDDPMSTSVDDLI